MSIRSMIIRNGSSCTVQERSTSRKKGGHKGGVTWAASKSGLTAWPQPASSSIIERYAKRELAVEQTVYFFEDPEIDEKRATAFRLAIGGEKYGVKGARHLAGGRQEHWEVDIGGAE